MQNKSLSWILFALSAIAVIIAIIDSFKVNVWLSATSWLVIAGVLGIWAIYFKPCDCKCCQDEK